MGVRIQPPKRTLTRRDYEFITLAILLFLLIFAILVLVNLRFPAGGGDFYVQWVGSRFFLFDHIDPYSGQVPARVQQLVYGGPAEPGNEPFILDTPFHLLPLYFPISLLSNPMLARAMYTALLELGLCALTYLSLRLTDWETPRAFFIGFLLFGLFNFYAFAAVYEGNPVVLLGIVYAAILLLLPTDLDELIGALIAISFYYWEVGGPFLFLIFLRLYYEGRGRVFAGLLMTSFILLAVSFFLYPDWVIPSLRAGLNNLRTDYGFNIHAALANLWPGPGRTIAWIFIVVMIFILVYEWSVARSSDLRRFYWTACLTLTATPLLGFRTEIEHLVVLIIPLALVFAIIYDRWHRIGDGLALFLLLLVFGVPWFMLYLGPSRVDQDMLFLFLPVFTLAGLYWIRWWMLKPPRTWIDMANKQ